MPGTNIDELPEELLEDVFGHLDSAAPSERKAREEPSLGLINSPHHPIKNISCVSRRWRRIVLPLLFKYTCLRLDIPRRETWFACPACSDLEAPERDENDPALRKIDKYHVDMTNHAKRSFKNWTSPFNEQTGPLSRSKEIDRAAWAWRFYHVLQDFCGFLRMSNLGAGVRGVVVLTGYTIDGPNRQLLAKYTSACGWRSAASAMLWRHLFSAIQPQRIVLVAPPTELLCLTNAQSATLRMAAFEEMDFHLLELQCNPSTASNALTPIPEYANLSDFMSTNPNFAKDSLLNLREWTHLSLNEGSFLRGYSGPRYFDHGSPTSVCSIKLYLDHWLHSSSVRSAAYTAIFPFSGHVSFVHWLGRLENFDVQFAAGPESSILDDKDRIGTVALDDCWRELMEAYTDIAWRIDSSQMSRERYPRLRKVTCRDFQIPALREDLDEIFTSCCLPVWVEWTRGVYSRAAMSPHREHVDNQ